MKLSNRLKAGLLGIVVSGLALGFIITQLSFDTFIQAWQQADYSYVVPCLLLLLLGLFTRAARWRVLLRDQLPYQRTFSIMNIAYLVNGVLPFRIGEVARVYLVSRTKKAIPIFETTSTIIVERLLDLLAIAMMVLLALAFGPVPPEIQTASTAAAIAAIVGFGVLIALASWREHSAKLVERILSFMPFINEKLAERLHAWFMQFLDGLLPLTKPHLLLSAVGWTVVSWAVSVAAGYVLMFAFFEQGSLAATMLYIAAAAFAIALPAVPGNLGTYEGSILLALVFMGYEQTSTAVAFAVMVHAVNVFVHASTGVLGFIQEGISWQQLSQGVRNMQQTNTEAGMTSQ